MWNCSAELLNLKRRERIAKTFLELIERIVLIILRLDGHIGVPEVDPCLLEYLVGFWWPILLESLVQHIVALETCPDVFW